MVLKCFKQFTANSFDNIDQPYLDQEWEANTKKAAYENYIKREL